MSSPILHSKSTYTVSVSLATRQTSANKVTLLNFTEEEYNVYASGFQQKSSQKVMLTINRWISYFQKSNIYELLCWQLLFVCSLGFKTIGIKIFSKYEAATVCRTTAGGNKKH